MGLATGASGLLTVTVILISSLILFSIPVLAIHTSTAELQPEWSASGQTMEYTVTFYNNASSQDDIGEVRIYQNDNYEEFECDEKTGWILSEPAPGICNYYGYPRGTVKIIAGQSEFFTFSAKTSVDPTDTCQLIWQFETRDLTFPNTGSINYLNDTTSIDSDPPEITKDVIGPQVGDCDPAPALGEAGECWVMDHETQIQVQVTDDISEVCDSGIDWCTYSITLDGTPHFTHTFDPDPENDPTLDMGWTFNFTEDSVHVLNITCVDVAGNRVEDIEVFHVDSTPPTTTKEISEPKKIAEIEGQTVEWVDTVTNITLTTVDGGPICAVGVDKVWYNNIIDLTEQSCWVEEACNPVMDLVPFEGEWSNPADEVGCIDAMQDYCEQEMRYTPNTEDWYDCVEYWATEECGVDPIWKLYRGVPIQKDEPSCHILTYFGVDHLGNVEEPQANCFFVDKHAPEVLKDNGNAIWDFGEPYFMNEDNIRGEFHWLTTSMPITLDCDDSWDETVPHPSGDEQMCFKVSYDYPKWGYITDEYCDTALNQDGYCCVDVSSDSYDFYFQEESMHNLEYYCIDAVEKKSPVHVQYYKVDDTEPNITKVMIGTDHLGECPPGPNPSEPCYVRDDGQNGVAISVVDGGDICAVDDMSCYYELWWQASREECAEAQGFWNVSTGWCLVDSDEFGNYSEVIFYEDSTHELYIYCEDALGNWVDDTETFLVDSTPPETVKTYGEPYKADPECVSYYEWECDYFGYEPYDSYEECVMSKVHMNCPQWITGGTSITLSSEDEKVGVEKIVYGDAIVPDEACYMPGEYCHPVEMQMTEVLDDEITFYKEDEESCHVIQYYAVDLLGNTEQIKYQCVFVDNTPPEGIKEVGDPNIPCVELECLEFDYWVRDPTVAEPTIITLDCEDGGDHPVEQETMCYRVSFDVEPWLTEEYCDEFGGEMTGVEDDDWCCVYVGDEECVEKSTCEPEENVYEFYFMEDSLHDLEFYCMDHLGNTEQPADVEYFKVDSIPPVTTKTYVPDAYIDPSSQLEYIDTQHMIELTAEDGGPTCAVGGVETYYRVSGSLGNHFCNNCENWLNMLRPDMGPWMPYQGPFGIPNESCHVIEFYSEDALGNPEEMQWQCVFVDKTPPVITKEYGEPIFPIEICETDYPHYISSLTPINISAYDPEPHPSGLDELWYRVSIVNDENCMNYTLCHDEEGDTQWIPINSGDEITIPDDSCHLIEIKAIDNVDKETMHKQCVFVDNQAPDPLKEVGEPKTPWDGKDAKFYDLDDFCMEPGKCWKVTILTPINLECVDPQPHPVDHETVCFKVELDAEDATETYCDESHYDGTPTVRDNETYCCLEKELDEPFYFGEVSEHNLAYYCVDALGNTGPIDDEKFKVEDTAFEIELNRKWNLISVPVKLLDGAMDEAFADVADTVETVWTYDGETGDWYVYTPNGDSSDDSLMTMLPGWGYWVLSNEDDLLVIGGSLMSPAMVPPSKPIVAGWNLIGYYGAEGAPEGDNGYPGYYGPDVNGDIAKCVLNTLGVSMWDKGFTSLWTYWEPDNPEMWKALNKISPMDPGAGYWLMAQEDGIYTPSTTCM